MIRKLRRRFILITMLSVSLVLLIIMGTINYLNYRNVVKDADTVLAMLREFDGSFPWLDTGDGPDGAGFGPADSEFGMPAPPEGGENPAEMPVEDPDAGAPEEGADAGVLKDNADISVSDGGVVGGSLDDSTDTGVPDKGVPTNNSYENWRAYQRQNGRNMKRGFGGIGGEFSAETPFESRYFSVTVDSDGTVVSTDTSRIAAVDADEASSLAETVFSRKQTTGFSGWYRFLKYEEDDGTVSILFLDCQRSLSNFRSFLLISVLVSISGFAAVLLLVILLSGRVVRPVQESYEKQKRFITDAGHELKTPLTIIDADVSVLEMDIGENEWIDDVRMQTKRLADLTGDLIYLSRMDEENIQLQKIDFPLSDVAAETTQSFRSRAQVEGKTFSADIEPGLSLYGEEKSIRQLITILLDNAVKYASDEGNISFSVSKKGKHTEIEVKNTTDGIDQDTLAHMFDRFYRADQSRNSGKGGYGIGLSIASAIVAAHKGRISASSPDGRLMEIRVVLPVTQ